MKFFKSKNNFQFCHPELDSGSSILNPWMPPACGTGREQVRHAPSTTLRVGNRKSFTLIELLVVLALVAILSVVVILTLNPAELLKQARDSNRLSDLATINTALNLFSTDVIGGFMGTSTVVYVSIPDSSSVCSNLGLPTLPTGYTYNCVTSQNLRNTDGTGWIPVNFGRISSNSPISQLPIDPTNTTSTRLYYTYTPGGSWELNASIEASKNKLGGANDLTSKDGGSAPSLYELGNNLNLNPIEQGDPALVGYWNFEEGSGTTVYDGSGNNASGNIGGSGQHYAVGKVGSWAAEFVAANSNYIRVPSFNLSNTSVITISFWMNWGGFADDNQIAFEFSDNYNSYSSAFIIAPNSSGGLGFPGGYFQASLRGASGYSVGGFSRPTANAWHHYLFIFDKGLTSGEASSGMYLDGVLQQNVSSILDADNSENFGSFPLNFMSRAGTSYFANGYLDDLRIYSRALSAAEILALYNAIK